VIVYVSVGNSDDKLTQQEWARLLTSMWYSVHNLADTTVHGEWHSPPTAAYQNACWCLEFAHDDTARAFKVQLSGFAEAFRQDGIAWAEMSATEFIGPAA
jgi:hypothetical protein